MIKSKQKVDVGHNLEQIKFNMQRADEYCIGMSEFLEIANGDNIKCSNIKKKYIEGVAKFLNFNIDSK